LDLRETIDLSIFLTGYFQRSVVEHLVDAIPVHGVVLDIGANRGSVAVPLVKLESTCTVYAIEPVNELVGKIEQLLVDNPEIRNRVRVENVFLSSLGSVTNMKLPESVDASWNLFDSDGQNPITGATALPLATASVESLDDFVARRGLERVDLIKLDVEGYELDVLRGGNTCIDRFRPSVVMEWNPYLCELRGNSLSELQAFWQARSYTAHRLRRKRRLEHVSWDDLFQLRGLSHVDLLLRPTRY
jgi:FkbM family methyltransferase